MTTSPEPPSPSAAWAFFLDVDGTLLELASSPSAVRLQPRVRTLVRDLHAHTNGALALVSGRAIADIGAMFGALVARHTGLRLEDIRYPHSCGPTLVFIGDDVTDEDGCKG